MSETIEERYENLRKWVEKKKSRYPYVSVETSAVMPLLDDLMTERGKPVNLDEIFPKEVMETPGRFFRVYGVDADSLAATKYSVQDAIDRGIAFYGYGLHVPREIDVVALHVADAQWKELARVRVRLGLTVEIVEDK